VRRERDRAASRSDGDEVAVDDAEGRPAWVHLAQWLGYWATRAAIAPVCVPDRYCDDHSAGGQQHGILVVDDFGRRLERHNVEPRLPSGVELAALVQALAYRDDRLRDRPEQPISSSTRCQVAPV
jgi:hypothetical protein